MRDVLECKYINRRGEQFEFGTTSAFLNESDIRNYRWLYTTQYNKVKSLYKELEERTLPVVLAGEGLFENAERLYAVTDYDVMTGEPGTLYIGDYYISAFVNASSKDTYTNGVVIHNQLGILSDFRWHKEVYKIFGFQDAEPTGDNVGNFPHDYPWDYAPPGSASRLNSESVGPFDFEIVFQGPAINPMVIVEGNVYRVFTTIGRAETLTINSLDKEIYHTSVRGRKTNQFMNRDREHYVFEKMPAVNGISKVVWQTGHVVSIKAFTERSEPRWI